MSRRTIPTAAHSCFWCPAGDPHELHNCNGRYRTGLQLEAWLCPCGCLKRTEPADRPEVSRQRADWGRDVARSL